MQLIPVLDDSDSAFPGCSSCSCTSKGCEEPSVPGVLLELPLELPLPPSCCSLGFSPCSTEGFVTILTVKSLFFFRGWEFLCVLNQQGSLLIPSWILVLYIIYVLIKEETVCTGDERGDDCRASECWQEGASEQVLM